MRILNQDLSRLVWPLGSGGQRTVQRRLYTIVLFAVSPALLLVYYFLGSGDLKPWIERHSHLTAILLLLVVAVLARLVREFAESREQISQPPGSQLPESESQHPSSLSGPPPAA
jgi:hypothetical protein